jgi:hypothetical protein
VVSQPGCVHFSFLPRLFMSFQGALPVGDKLKLSLDYYAQP